LTFYFIFSEVGICDLHMVVLDDEECYKCKFLLKDNYSKKNKSVYSLIYSKNVYSGLPRNLFKLYMMYSHVSDTVFVLIICLFKTYTCGLFV